MPSYKISQLPATGGVTAGTLFEISKSGVSEKATLTEVTALVTTAYIAADAVVAASVTAEATTRANADTALTTDVNTRVKKDGSTPLTANWATGGFKLTGLAAGTTAGDSVRYEQVLLLAGGTMSGAIAMGTNKITGLGNPTAAQDAVTLAYLNSTRLVYVDASYGNDGTGAKYSQFKPYATITAAQTAAVSGDTIVVYPGTYSETNLGKTGVNYHLLNGCIVAATTGNGFVDTGGLVYSITGDGEITSTTGNAIEANAGGTISVACKKISSTTGYCLYSRNASVIYANVQVSVISTLGRCYVLNDTSYLFVTTQVTTSGGYAVAYSNSGSTTLSLISSVINGTGTTLFDILGFTEIYGHMVYSGVGSAIVCSGAGVVKHNFHGQLVNESSAKAVEFTAANTGYVRFYNSINGTGVIDVSGCLATFTFYDEISTQIVAAPSITMTTGTVKVLSRITNLDNNAASYGVLKTAGTLILQNATIVTSGATACVYSAAARDIKILGTLSANVALGANITDVCAGIQQIDSNVE